MSTNFYYVSSSPCTCCGREYPAIHLGKRAAGWKFILHAVDRSDTWEKLKARIHTAYRIFDEYGASYTFAEMTEIVEDWQKGKSHAINYPGQAWHDENGYVLSEGDWS